jgi:hypothetical protein
MKFKISRRCMQPNWRQNKKSRRTLTRLRLMMMRPPQPSENVALVADAVDAEAVVNEGRNPAPANPNVASPRRLAAISRILSRSMI